MKQVEQLLEMEVFEAGLFLTEFQQIYEQEFGYPLDYRSYGFFSLQDFCYHGLQGSARLELVGQTWKLCSASNLMCGKVVGVLSLQMPEVVKNYVKGLVQHNPFGMSCSFFMRNYENYFGHLDVREFLCSDLYELLLLLPDSCSVVKDAGWWGRVLAPFMGR